MKDTELARDACENRADIGDASDDHLHAWRRAQAFDESLGGGHAIPRTNCCWIGIDQRQDAAHPPKPLERIDLPPEPRSAITLKRAQDLYRRLFGRSFREPHVAVPATADRPNESPRAKPISLARRPVAMRLHRGSIAWFPRLLIRHRRPLCLDDLPEKCGRESAGRWLS